MTKWSPEDEWSETSYFLIEPAAEDFNGKDEAVELNNVVRLLILQRFLRDIMRKQLFRPKLSMFFFRGHKKH